MHAERVTGLQRNLSAIRPNVHQMCRPIVDKAFSRHDEGMALWSGSPLKIPLFQGLASKSTRK